MDKFEIKTVFKHMEYDKKFDHGNMANVNDILYASPMQGVMEQIQDVVHQSDLAHDNFIKECIVSVGVDPNALIETAKLNAELQYELKLLRMGMLRREDRWISVDERLPDVCGMSVLMVAVNEYGQTNVVKGFTDYACPIDFHTNEREYHGIWHAWKVTHWMPLPEPPKGV